MILKPRMDEILTQQGLLTAEQLEACLASAQAVRQPIEEAALQQGLFSEQALRQALETHFGVPYVDLVSLRPDPAVMRAIPERVVRDYHCLAFKRQDDGIAVACVNPLDVDSMSYLSLVLASKVYPFVTTEKRLEHFLTEYYTSELMQMVVKDIPEIEEAATRADDTSEGAEPATVASLVDTILEQAVLREASDIHLEPQEKVVLLRLRRDGMVETAQAFPKTLQTVLCSRIKVLAGMNLAQKRLPQEGGFRIAIRGRELDMRISTLPGRHGEAVAIEVHDPGAYAMPLEQVGLSQDAQVRLYQALRPGSGLILVAGPAGSGRTTTLYALVDKVRRPQFNLVTVEDPIAAEILAGKTREGGVTQMQVNARAGLTFPVALRAALRHDPDVVVLGEIVDGESARIACDAAATGHLILGTIHALDGPAAVTRLLDLGVNPFAVAGGLQGVLTQRLLRLLCPECKERYNLAPGARQRFEVHGMKESDVLYRPAGCRACQLTGYAGRRGIFEFLTVDGETRSQIQCGASTATLRAALRQRGIPCLRDHGTTLVCAGLTTVAELLRVTPQDA